MKIFFGGDLSYKGIVIDSLGRGRVEETKEVKEADLIYWVYGTGPKIKSHYRVWFSKKQKIIIHWIGTDVLIWRNKMLGSENSLRSRLHFKVWRIFNNWKREKGLLKNFSGADWLKDELAEIGIISEVVPLTTLRLDMVKAYQRRSIRQIDFVSYIPISRYNFYNGEMIRKLAFLMPDFSFLIIHPDIKATDTINVEYPPNVNALPNQSFRDMQNILGNSKCFLRFTEHDGLSLSVLEALASELEVLWTYKFPHCRYRPKIREVQLSELSYELRNVIENWTPNTMGREHVLNNYSMQIAIERFKSNLNWK